jgi:Arc/MetJ-type ribon-helix-helix transcriptional regulator
MATVKTTITLQEDDVRKIRDLVATGRATSISGFVQDAVAVALQDVAGWGALLAGALEQTGGPLTSEERAWADTILAGGEARRGRRSRAA